MCPELFAACGLTYVLTPDTVGFGVVFLYFLKRGGIGNANVLSVLFK